MTSRRPDWPALALMAALPVGYALFVVLYNLWAPAPGEINVVYLAETLSLGLVLVSIVGAGFLMGGRAFLRQRPLQARDLPFGFGLACAFLLGTAFFLAAAHGSARDCQPTDFAGMCMLFEDAKRAYAFGVFGAGLLAGGFGGAALTLGVQRLRQARGAILT